MLDPGQLLPLCHFCNFIVTYSPGNGKGVFKIFSGTKNSAAHKGGAVSALSVPYDSIPREIRYFFTIRATLKVMASSNSRRSRPVSFLIFSSRYTRVFR